MIESKKTKAEKELESFAKDYKKLLEKYSWVSGGNDIDGDTIAYMHDEDKRQISTIKIR